MKFVMLAVVMVATALTANAQKWNSNPDDSDTDSENNKDEQKEEKETFIRPLDKKKDKKRNYENRKFGYSRCFRKDQKIPSECE